MAMESFRSRLKVTFSLARRVMFFDATVFKEIKARKDSVENGVLLIALIGLTVGAAAGIGTYLEYIFTPFRLEEIMNMVTAMPWFAQMKPEAREIVNRIFKIAEMFIAPSPLKAIADAVTALFSSLLSWLIFGILIHLSAKLFRGKATLWQMMACTAFAVGPQIIRVAEIVPFVGPAVGLLATLWGVACYIMGVKYAHMLSTGKAILCCAFPLLVIIFLVGLLVTAIISAIAQTVVPFIAALAVAAVIIGPIVYLARR